VTVAEFLEDTNGNPAITNLNGAVGIYANSPISFQGQPAIPARLRRLLWLVSINGMLLGLGILGFDKHHVLTYRSVSRG
jgi:hypothetical protein